MRISPGDTVNWQKPSRHRKIFTMPDKSENLPVSEFVFHLKRINRLDKLGFDRFVFFPGMLFLSRETWWGKSGVRKTAHEGLDICFFINCTQKKYRLDETVQVPVLYKGRVVHVMDDFLGQTVVVRHRANASDKEPCLSFYAHIRPDRGLQIGDVVESGKTLGSIADASLISSPLISHLHLSLAWESLLPPVDTLSWKILNQVDRSVFMDPIKYLSGQHLKMPDAPDGNIINDFIKCNLNVNL
jgi:hypothetical protein